MKSLTFLPITLYRWERQLGFLLEVGGRSEGQKKEGSEWFVTCLFLYQQPNSSARQLLVQPQVGQNRHDLLNVFSHCMFRDHMLWTALSPRCFVVYFIQPPKTTKKPTTPKQTHLNDSNWKTRWGHSVEVGDMEGRACSQRRGLPLDQLLREPTLTWLWHLPLSCRSKILRIKVPRHYKALHFCGFCCSFFPLNKA